MNKKKRSETNDNALSSSASIMLNRFGKLTCTTTQSMIDTKDGVDGQIRVQTGVAGDESPSWLFSKKKKKRRRVWDANFFWTNCSKIVQGKDKRRDACSLKPFYFSIRLLIEGGNARKDSVGSRLFWFFFSF